MTTDVPRFVCRNHIPVITSFMTYVYNMSNTTGTTSRERTAIFPEHMNSPPVLCGVCFAQSNIMCNVLYIIVCHFCPFSSGHCSVCLSLIFEF